MQITNPFKDEVRKCPYCKCCGYKATDMTDTSEGPLERLWKCTCCRYQYWIPDYIAGKGDFD